MISHKTHSICAAVFFAALFSACGSKDDPAPTIWGDTSTCSAEALFSTKASATEAHYEANLESCTNLLTRSYGSKIVLDVNVTAPE